MPDRVSTAIKTSAGMGDLLLRVTPPRVPRHLLSRPRLMSGDDRLRGCPVVVVQAPAGFGKTSLLAQWRLEHLARGAVVAWLTTQRRDAPGVPGAGPHARRAAGRRTAGVRPHAARGAAAERDRGHHQLAGRRRADRARHRADRRRGRASAAPSRMRLLEYLLRNAPANLRVVVAARADSDLGIDDLIEYGQCIPVGASLLRFELAETIALVRNRLGAAFDVDTAARLHELTEGWPLGVQLALAVMARAARTACRGGGPGQRRWRAARAVRVLAAGQPRPGRSRVPDLRRDRRPAAPRSLPGDRRCAGRGGAAGATHARHADLRHGRARRVGAHARPHACRAGRPLRRAAGRQAGRGACACGAMVRRARPARSIGAACARRRPARAGLRACRAEPVRLDADARPARHGPRLARPAFRPRSSTAGPGFSLPPRGGCR